MQYKFSGPEFSQGTDLFPEFHTIVCGNYWISHHYLPVLHQLEASAVKGAIAAFTLGPVGQNE